MQILPAIDILGGRCVQLVGGKPETKKEYGDPVEYGLKWKAEGAGMLHIVDLDATLGTGSNLDTVLKVKEATGLPIHFGGGIRSLESAQGVLKSLTQHDRIIVGTLAVKDYPDFVCLKQLGEGFPGRVIISVDSKDKHVAVRGWTQKSSLKPHELIQACSEYAWGFLYTNVDVEGRMAGVEPDSIRTLVAATKKPVIVSGGITTDNDMDVCERAGAWGVVLGKALYEGKLSLR